MISITKEFVFDAAHSLEGYDGKCREVHGHTYHLSVTVRGDICRDASSPRFGMVIDFAELKGIVRAEVVDRFDHSFIMRRSELSQRISETLGGELSRVELVDYQPTSENMVEDFARRIASRLPDGIELASVRLSETESSMVEWTKD